MFREFVRYFGVSAVAAAIDFSLFSLLAFLGLFYPVAIISGYMGGHLFGFAAGRSYAFERLSMVQLGREFAMVTTIALVGLGVNLVIVWVIYAWGGLLDVYSARIAAMGASLLWNYLGRRAIVYNGKRKNLQKGALDAKKTEKV